MSVRQLLRFRVVLFFLLFFFSLRADSQVVGWWSFDSNLKDCSGNNNDGVFVGDGAGLVRDALRGGVLRVNQDGYVSIPDSDLFDFTDKVTISCWYKDEGTTDVWGGIVDKWTFRIIREGSTDGCGFSCNGPTQHWTGGGNVTMLDGDWHHLAGTYDGSHLSYYLDGQLVSKVESTGNINLAKHIDIRIGRAVDDHVMNGLVDDVMVFDESMSQEQIQGLMKKGLCQWDQPGFEYDKTAAGVIDLLSADNASKWHGNGGMTISLADGKMVGNCTCDGITEDFPALQMYYSSWDLRAYTKLSGRIRITSEDANVESKLISVILYDKDARYESVDGHNQAHQYLSKFVVKKDEWVDFEYDLTTFKRGRSNSLTIFCYETPPGFAHSYSVEVTDLKFVSPDPDCVVFDKNIFWKYRTAADQGFKTPVISGSCDSTAASLSTQNDLSLAISNNGGINSVQIAGNNISGTNSGPAGFLVRDAKTCDAPAMIEFDVQAGADSDNIVLNSRPNAFGLDVSAQIANKGDYIEFDTHLDQAGNLDRMLTVYYAIPVDGLDWEWAQNITHSSDVAAEYSVFNQVEFITEKYPVGSLSSDSKGGVSIAIDLDEPCVYRLGYNPKEKLLYAAFDLALINQQNVKGQNLSSADVKLYLFRHDSQWGMRSALEKYYKMFPEKFESAAEAGGWGAWLNQSTVGDEVLQKGIKYNWGGSPDAYQWNKDHGIYNLYYIEPEYYQQTMGDYDSVSDSDAIERLEKIAAGDTAELTGFLELAYAKNYAAHMTENACQLWGKTRGEFFTQLSDSSLKSVIRDNAGYIDANLGNRAWIGDTNLGSMLLCNLDPDIPLGKGWFNSEVSLKYQLQSVALQTGVEVDGFALDCLLWKEAFDFYPDNFKYSDFNLPFVKTQNYLGFSESTGFSTALPNWYATVEWLKSLKESTQYKDKIIMSNTGRVGLTFAAQYIDVMGLEAGFVEDPEYLRTMAYRKPITDLVYTPRADWQTYYNLLFNVFHGQGHTEEIMKQLYPKSMLLSEAGWEPVTYAKESAGNLRIERYGRGDHFYLVVHNPQWDAVSADVEIDLQLLDLESFTASEQIKDKVSAVESNRLTFEIGSLETLMFEITGNDIYAPRPAKAGWLEAPTAKADGEISMTAQPCYDPAGVEYYFECVQGPGHSSEWQKENVYSDHVAGFGQICSYKVHVRDASANHNAVEASEAASVMTFLAWDFNSDGIVDLNDFTVFSTVYWMQDVYANLINPGFDDDVLADGLQMTELANGWSNMWGAFQIANLSDQQWNARYNQQTDLTDGENLLSFGVNGGIAQLIEEEIRLDTLYKLYIPVGMPINSANSWVNIKLSTVNSENQVNTLLQYYVYENSAAPVGCVDLEQGGWVEQTFEFDSSSLADAQGLKLHLQIRGSNVDVDNIRLVVCDSPADFNEDCQVDMLDLTELAEDWLRSSNL